MEVVELLKYSLKTVSGIVHGGAKIQDTARKSIIKQLHAVCSNCEEAYNVLMNRLLPVKAAYGDPPALARELLAFGADSKARRAFKPEHLCGQIDHILLALRSNLDPLKYSIDVQRVDDVRKLLGDVGNYDANIYRSYDDFVFQLGTIARQIRDGDAHERSAYAEAVVTRFEQDLRSALDTIRVVKGQIVDTV